MSTDLTPLLDARQNQLQLESAAGDAIDAKALGALAADLAVLIFIEQSMNVHSGPVLCLVLAFFVSLVLAVSAMWPQEYSGASVSIHDHPEYLGYTTERLVAQLVVDTETAIANNRKINARRWMVLRRSLLIMGPAFLTLLALLYLR